MNETRKTGLDLAIAVIRNQGILCMRGVAALGGITILPTVWSNCLAGWCLGGSNGAIKLFGLIWGTSLLFIGASFFHHAYLGESRVGYSGGARYGIVYLENRQLWLLSLGWFGAGFVILAFLGKAATVLAVILCTTMVVYVTISGTLVAASLPLFLMRLLLYLLAGSASLGGITGGCVWNGLALGSYMAGVGFIADRDPLVKRKLRWQHLLLAAPVFLAVLVNELAPWNLVLCILFLLWLAWGLRFWIRSLSPNIRYTSANLLAGIVLIDLMATHGQSVWLVPVFILLFLATLALGRYVALKKVF